MTSPDSPNPTNTPDNSRWLRWVIPATLAFGVFYLISYFATPLGLAPQLDAKENLAIAEQIALGDLPGEPMYRAMFYPWVLSLFMRIGVAMEWMPVVASLLGFLCHLAATVFAALLAARLWRSETAGLIAGLLYGINPVAVYFAVIPFDITLAIALFLGALWTFTAVSHPARAALAGGSLLALAVLARPHFLTLAVVAPVLFWGMRGEWKPLRPAAFAAWIPCVAALLLFGTINRSLSDEFRVLPWQGAYNLYAANKSGADGRFHVQSVFLTEIDPHENPTRLESELLYAQETGREPPFSVDEMNDHWRAATVRSVREDFSGWLALKLRKTYYLLNNWEQYNNLTYAYHERENLLLRINPIGWGLLLMGAAAGGFIALIRRDKRFLGLLIAGIVYAGGVGLFIVSARFRLPLAPLLCIFAAGTVYALPAIFRSGNTRRIAAFVAVLVLTGAVAFSRFLDVADTSTFVQDESLIANAAAELGHDAQACRYATRVLERRPDRPDALRILLVSYLNLRLVDDPAWEEFGDWDAHRDRLEKVPVNDAVMRFVAGCYRWRLGETEEAVRLWQEAAADESGSAQAILVLAGIDTTRSPDAVHPVIREQLERVIGTDP